MAGGILTQVAPTPQAHQNGTKRAHPPSSAKDVSAYSELQTERLEYKPALPPVLCSPLSLKQGGATTSAEHPDQIKALFPNLYGKPNVHIVADPQGKAEAHTESVKIGVVLSGGQAPGGHNVISGLYDYLQVHNPGSTLYGFRGGPAGVMNCKVVELHADFIYPYRNQGGFDIIGSGRDKIESPEQFLQAEETVKKLDLDGLVVIGGDDSNTNAAVLAEYFLSRNVKTKVIGCPKTIDGDLKCKEVPISFGFDTACKIYSEMIGNIMLDAKSAAKYYHFVRLMGRAASHITLECAFQTRPNIALIGEEVAEKNQSLCDVVNSMCDVICKRAEADKNYGVVLIPEGLIDFIPEVHHLISELNDITAAEEGPVLPDGAWREKLGDNSRGLFNSFPRAIQEMLLLERDPHGNVQVSKIEMEKLLIDMVTTELKSRKAAGHFKGKFNAQPHFFGYEGRCGLPTNFDATYCYALGFVAGALLDQGQTGLISSVGNLAAPSNEWTVGGTNLTTLMCVEKRKGKNKPVIKKAMTELNGAPFLQFAEQRDRWAVEDCYRCPGPIQFHGPSAEKSNFTLVLEQGGLQ
ncbi:pyrophosphate--fructose-6-phosphate 1-phosphotransferase [Klebsormidium nitens]|uniref:Pyrophosphate--fructose 6-phosphate 1-phosphotransferase subunit beta n=1 Tax=Klebsormidium nitens TaxID=105231 RepID=A0A1Y1IDH3_KLENI|nr:pyrophosphate--fructose-6-phosphate 1-phosphotransferase [Klebsormidium nitens]|eukprot:GAQ89015.1 pyrophosphate--fructose-6-phosphate 1-phosphotransferase [Klebsormidium nitens]